MYTLYGKAYMSRDAGRHPICALYRRHGFLKFNQNFFYQNIRPITKASLEEKKNDPLSPHMRKVSEISVIAALFPV